MIKTISSFSVVRSNREQNSSLVACDGIGKAELSGSVIELQVAYKNNFLLFLTEDCPFEEVLHVNYLDKQLTVLDYFKIDNIYSPGIFKLKEIKQPDKILFEFMSDGGYWLLTILDKPAFKTLGGRSGGIITHKKFLLDLQYLKIQFMKGNK